MHFILEQFISRNSLQCITWNEMIWNKICMYTYWRIFSELCVLLFFLGKSTKCSQNPGLVKEFSATPRGQLNWTGWPFFWDPPVLKIPQRKFSTGTTFATTIAQRYGECLEMLVSFKKKGGKKNGTEQNATESSAVVALVRKGLWVGCTPRGSCDSTPSKKGSQKGSRDCFGWRFFLKPQPPHTRQKYEQKHGPQTAEFTLFWSIWSHLLSSVCSYFCLVCGGAGVTSVLLLSRRFSEWASEKGHSRRRLRETHAFSRAQSPWRAPCSENGLRVKTQRVKTSENFSEESNLPRRFREDIQKYFKNR